MDNEKLLKFVGFTYYDNSVIYGGKIQKTGWYTPDDCKCRRPPDFEKVDNCIKWLLPKIEDLDGVWFYPNTTGGYRWVVNVINCPIDAFEGDTLAEAIEQYVIFEEDEKV